MNKFFSPCEGLRGEIVAPPDKSITHRAYLLAAMSDGEVLIRNPLVAADTDSTLNAVTQLGAKVVSRIDNELKIKGVRLRNVSEPQSPIDVGNAGTLMRILPGWLAGQVGRKFTLTGDESIQRRPVDRIVNPLTEMGGRLNARDSRFPPLTVEGSQLHGIEYDLPIASAQVKSAVLIAGLLADSPTDIREPAISRDHTERMLIRAGVPINRQKNVITVEPVNSLQLSQLDVPGDPSSAAFWLAAAAIIPDSQISILNVGVNWTRTGFIEILKRMGVKIIGDTEQQTSLLTASEPISDLQVSSSDLIATEVHPDEVPLSIDELPLVALLGCYARGKTVVRGAGELRVKESDRIATVVGGLERLGAQIQATDDGFVVIGNDGLDGGQLNSHGDHRLAMLGVIAGLASRRGVDVNGVEALEVSYPEFLGDLSRLTNDKLR